MVLVLLRRIKASSACKEAVALRGEWRKKNKQTDELMNKQGALADNCASVYYWHRRLTFLFVCITVLAVGLPLCTY